MRSPLSLVVAAALIAAPASAQSNPCADRGARLPAAGAWASYTADSGDFKLLYLGHESAGDRLEMTATRMSRRNGQPSTMTMQMVVPGYPYEMDQISEMVMQMEGQPPMKMSGQMLGMMRSRMPRNQNNLAPDACARMTKVGTESVTVPAGTFTTTHYRDAQSNTDVWVDPAVPFGMVKVVSGDRTVVLKERGTGGRTAITGTPQEMGPGMMGPPGGRPRNQ